jgi:hypothetical protein
MRVGAAASLLGGTIRAEAELRGAMLAGGGESPLVYAGALAKGCVVLIGCADANIWAKFQDGKVNGGFGKDPAMDAIIARADAARDNMQNAKDEAQAAINDAQADANTIALSEEELAAIFRRVSQAPGMANLQTIIQKEQQYAQFSTNWWAELAHYNRYDALLNLESAPRQPWRVDDLEAVRTGAAAINQTKPRVLSTVSGIQVRTL